MGRDRLASELNRLQLNNMNRNDSEIKTRLGVFRVLGFTLHNSEKINMLVASLESWVE